VCKKNIINYLLLIIILSLLVNSSVAFYFSPVIDRDSVDYMKMAEYISNGHIEDACKMRPEVPMLYQYILSLGDKVGFYPELFGKYLSIICSAILAVLIFYISKFFLSIKLSLITSLLFFCNPLIIGSGSAVLRDSFSLLLMGVSVYFILSGIKEFKIYKYILAGIFAGLCAQTRISGIEILAFYPIYICISFIFFRKYDGYIFYRDNIFGLIILAVSFLVIAMPIQYYFQSFGSSYTVFLGHKLLDIYLI
jgi:hypothetical protein